MTLITTPIEKKKRFTVTFSNDEKKYCLATDFDEAIELETELQPKWKIIRVEEEIKRKGLHIEISTNRDKHFKEYEYSYIIHVDGKPVDGGVSHPKELLKTLERYIK